jgi:hypothetical protein
MQRNWAKMQQVEFHVLDIALLGAAIVDEERYAVKRLKRSKR